jgi:alpha-tubulin suppressor-like RCC1 family protein
MKLFGLTARVLASVLVFGVLTPIIPANAEPSPVTSPAPFQNAAAAKAAPKNTKAPTISGTPRVPNQLTVKNGRWSGAPTSYTYQWFRCNSAVKKAAATPAASCSTIGSATAATYSLTDADAGKFMVARVSGVNASGTASIHSASTAAITPRVIAPKNTVAATISGTAQVSRVLTASNGTWSESPVEFSYQWYQCSKAVKKASSSLTKGCTLIANQTDSTYQLASNDARKFVLARVSASNNAGSASVFTSTAGSVAIPSNYAPSLFAAPSMEFSGVDSEEEANAISGSPFLGSVLVASKGQWLGYPLPEVSYSYWFRCDLSHTTASTFQPVDCEGIPGSNGANGETYLVSTQDVGKYLAFGVIVVNSAGTIRYFTPTTNSVVAIPTLLNPPVLSGTPRYGQNLSVTDGRWSVASGISMSFGYRWFRCDSGSPVISGGRPSNCSQASGQTGSSYALSEADLGKFIVASVTATNSFNESVVVASNVSTQVLSAPTLVTAPTVSGTRVTGSSMMVSGGSWVAFPNPSTTYQWFRCENALIVAIETLPSTCASISGATEDSYTQTADDSAKYLTVAVTKSNSVGQRAIWLSSTQATLQPPTVLSPPTLTGVPAVGATVSVNLDSLRGFPNPTYAVTWYLCAGSLPESIGTLPAGCSSPYPQLKQVSAGYEHTCAAFFGGSLSCWGDNFRGQLGNGRSERFAYPYRVGAIANAESVSGGSAHTCALLFEGSIKCWGENASGQLGDGTWTQRWSPYTSVWGVSNAVSLSLGFEHSCALLGDGTVKCWGENGTKQLGNGSTTDSRYPVIVFGVTSATSVATGQYHSCSSLADGSVKCWGAKSYLGAGNFVEAIVAENVIGISNAVMVSAGDQHTCALLADGAVKCWGSNGDGQLGNGSTRGAAAPVTVSGISDAVSIEVGTKHTCALLDDGTVKCWGSNYNGQLGDGSMLDSATPVIVPGVSDAVTVTVGGNHSCAMLLGGSVKCWGMNFTGQLGDGTESARSIPVSVQFPANSSTSLSLGADSLGKYLLAYIDATNEAGSLGVWVSTDQVVTPAP